MGGIVDKYGRTFKTLRVSLLSHCNLGCVYCVAGEDSGANHAQISVPGLLAMIGGLHAQLQLKTVRLTGGEPLLYRGLTELIRGIHAIGVHDIKLTTNGFLLKRLAWPIKEAGMGSINVSLDAIDEDVFFTMSKRRSVQRIIDGIDAAMQAGLTVKINSVIMRGMNESQILPLLDFAVSRGIPIRFLELMAMGHLHDKAASYLFSKEEILEKIATRHRFRSLGRAEHATANYWETDQGHIFGVIANESEPFCGDCDRLRLDSQGNIYGCLSDNHPIPLNAAAGQEDWGQKLQEALSQKQALRFTGSALSMLHIGG
jgi:cyclic pyranopterin phosphate synthase